MVREVFELNACSFARQPKAQTFLEDIAVVGFTCKNFSSENNAASSVGDVTQLFAGDAFVQLARFRHHLFWIGTE